MVRSAGYGKEDHGMDSGGGRHETGRWRDNVTSDDGGGPNGDGLFICEMIYYVLLFKLYCSRFYRYFRVTLCVSL